jgi:transcriptional regulator with XRE-family HTH domain
VQHSRATIAVRSKLRPARERARLSQGQVASLAGVRANAVARAENGGYASPALIAKVAIATAAYASLTNGHDPHPTVALELDERLELAEQRLAGLEEQLARAGIELAFQRAPVEVA